VRPGAAGPLQPFDLVVRAGGKPIRHLGDLDRAVQAAACGPLDLDVVREKPIELPGATLAESENVSLSAVPTCAAGKPAFLPADRNLSTFVASVVPGSPADTAGIRRGDAIAAVNGRPVRSFREVSALGRDAFQIGKPVKLALLDGRTVDLVPGKEGYVDDLTKDRAERMIVGFEPEHRSLVDARALVVQEVPLRRGVAESVAVSTRQLSEVVRLTLLGIKGIVTGHIPFKTVGGPIMLFSIASEAAEEGWASFLFKMALISVNLGLMNLLPIPVLDGGHIAQAAVEGVTRRPLSMRAREIANVVGLILLFTLMIFVFKNDLVRVFG
jgi:regulator of sigma E protease